MSTKHRAISVATVAFADKGVAATSLDEIASQLGVTKQTVLYHFGSKESLISEVFLAAAAQLSTELRKAVVKQEPGWDQVEAAVRVTFSMATQQPAILSLLREVSRLGSPWSNEVLAVFQPLIDDARRALLLAMDNGSFKTADPALVLLSTYALVTVFATDNYALGALGLGPGVRDAVRLRTMVLQFLRATLVSE